MSSLFSAILGYSRIPYAAAKDGKFFSIFAKVHPRKQFPHVSLLLLGATAFVFSLLFKLAEVIEAIVAIRIFVQFVSQAIGIMYLRKSRPAFRLPFRMWLYPLPAIVSIIIWLFLFFLSSKESIQIALGIIASGTIFFLIRAWNKAEWPFEKKDKDASPEEVRAS
jgi:amino acid transporter